MATKPMSDSDEPKKAAHKDAPHATGSKAKTTVPPMFSMPDAKQLSAYAKTLTPEQAFELYRQNAKLALQVIDAAIESTAKVRRLQFEGEEKARTMQRKAAQNAAEASDMPALMAAGQTVSQEAIEQAMAYWGQMFELVVEIQKRLFTLMDNQMSGVPGSKEAKEAMAIMPDLSQTQNLLAAMQNLWTSGGTAFESMQRMMGDFAKIVPGMKR